MKIIDAINKPEVKLVAGAIVGGAGVIFACLATLKLEKAIDEHNEAVDAIKNEYICVNGNGDVLTLDKRAYRKAITKTYISTAVKVGRQYAPAAGLFSLSAILIGGTYKDIRNLKTENLELAAGWKATESILKRYRQDMRDRIGAEAEQRFFSGVEVSDISVTEVDDEGREHKRTIKGAEIVNGKLHGYAFIFDKDCMSYVGQDKDIEHNLYIAKLIENQCTDNLFTHQSVTLNEIRDAFGVERVDEGFRIGCIPEKKGGQSNNVDLGIRTVWIFDERSNNYVERILIDPHLDGIIDCLI